jgi:hypothetical protein
MNGKESKSYPKLLIIYPTRGGPKGIHGKNLVDVCSSPII